MGHWPHTVALFRIQLNIKQVQDNWHLNLLLMGHFVEHVHAHWQHHHSLKATSPYWLRTSDHLPMQSSQTKDCRVTDSCFTLIGAQQCGILMDVHVGMTGCLYIHHQYIQDLWFQANGRQGGYSLQTDADDQSIQSIGQSYHPPACLTLLQCSKLVWGNTTSD